jgi:hypothetical protein
MIKEKIGEVKEWNKSVKKAGIKKLDSLKFWKVFIDKKFIFLLGQANKCASTDFASGHRGEC